MPVSGHLYGRPPFHYRDAEMLSIDYRTNAEQLARQLPPGLVPDGAKPRVSVVVTRNAFTTFGPYLGCSVWADVLLELPHEPPRSGRYVPWLYVTQEVPLTAGREIWGYPKKLARIELGLEQELIWATVDRPSPIRLATLMMRVDRRCHADELDDRPLFSLRLVPDPEGRAEHSLCELIEARYTTTPRLAADGELEVWFGQDAIVTFPASSPVDPLHLLPVQEIIGGYWGHFDAVMHAGTIVKNYRSSAETAAEPALLR